MPQGTRPGPGAVAAAAQPFPTPEPAGETLTPGVPRIAYRQSSRETSEIFLMGADGSGPVKLVGGMHNPFFCQSADGSLMGFYSYQEAPNDQFIYVANADGSNPRKVSEGGYSYRCGFSEEFVPLIVTTGRSISIIRHDLENGEETTRSGRTAGQIRLAFFRACRRGCNQTRPVRCRRLRNSCW